VPERHQRRSTQAKPISAVVEASRPFALARWSPVFVTALAAVFSLRRLGDFDTWWHLAAGRWIVEHASVPHTDTLSYTVPSHAWTNLQWFYDVVLYGLYSLGGADLLVVCATACFATAVWIAVQSAAQRCGPVAASVVGLAAVLIAEERFLIRPEMFSFIFVGLLLRVLFTAREDAGRRLRYLPLLFVAWVNTHALFIVGIVAVGAFAVGALAGRLGVLPGSWRRASDLGPDVTRRLLAWGVVSVAVTCLNPFLLEGAAFPVELLSRIDGSRAVFQSIGEFRSPFSGYFTTWSIGVFQAYFFTAIGIGALAALVGLKRQQATEVAPGFDLGAALLFVAVAYLATLARRNIGIFVFATLPILGSWLALVASRLGFARLAPVVLRRCSAAVAVTVTAACAVLGMMVVTNTYYRINGVTEEFGVGVFDANFPIHTAEFASQHALPPKLYNDLTAGGYFTWRPPVSGGVFIDGRLEVYDTDFFSKYMDALGNPTLWGREADAFGVQTVILFHRWPNRHALIRALAQSPAWALVYHDEVGIAFVRRAGNAEVIARAQQDFPTWDARTRERLGRPVASHAYAVERATALESYARLQMTLGASDRALEAWQSLLELDALTEDAEVSARYTVAWLLAGRGEKASALLQAQAAAALAPTNPDVQRLIERLSR
jgi:hypothetical protein